MRRAIFSLLTGGDQMKSFLSKLSSTLLLIIPTYFVKNISHSNKSEAETKSRESGDIVKAPASIEFDWNKVNEDMNEPKIHDSLFSIHSNSHTIVVPILMATTTSPNKFYRTDT